MLAGIGFFYRERIVPLQERQVETRKELGDLRTQLLAAQEEMKEIKGHEVNATRMRSLLNALYRDTPIGPAITWFPTQMKTHLSKFGVADVEVRLNASRPEPRLPGFERTFWHTSLPQQKGRKMTDVLLAVAQIEQDSFVKIIDVSLQSETGEPVWTAGQVNVAAFVRK